MYSVQYIQYVQCTVHVSETEQYVQQYSTCCDVTPHIIGTLKWKDDQGGNINEFMSQVQLTRPIVVGGQDSKKETITQLKPESAKEENR